MNTSITTVDCVFVVVLDGDLVQTPEHLGVSYLMAVMRENGYACILIDIPPDQEKQLLECIINLNPKIVGISLTTVNFKRATKIGNCLKSKLGATSHICAGGPIATFMGEKLLRHPDWTFLDSIVRGEGEEAIVALTKAILNNVPISFIPGVLTRENPLNVKPVVAIDDLDRLPWPSRDQLEKTLALNRKFPYVRISTSRGCTSYCTFCNAPHARNNLAKRKVWRGRSPENIINEIKYIKEKYHVDTFDFVDSTFEDPPGIGKKRIEDIANLLLKYDLRIYYNICSQAKNWHENDCSLLELLVKSGLEKVLIGIESGSNRMLQLFKKTSTVEDNCRALKLFKSVGIYVAFGFIMFNPFAEWQDIEDNASFLLENMGHNFRRFSTRLELYPGSEIISQIDNNNLLDGDYWDTLSPYAYKYINPGVGKMAKEINRIYGEHYVLQGSIKEEPSVFAFETFDITLHTFFSRLKRQHSEDSQKLEIIESYLDSVKTVKAALTNFNEGVFNHFLKSARRDETMDIESVARNVQITFAQATAQLKTIQLKLGMKLARETVSRIVSANSC